MENIVLKLPNMSLEQATKLREVATQRERVKLRRVVTMSKLGSDDEHFVLVILSINPNWCRETSNGPLTASGPEKIAKIMAEITAIAFPTKST